MINPGRQIVLDTETTGMNQIGAHYEGHCIIEIGAVEMINRKYTGNNFHIYIIIFLNIPSYFGMFFISNKL